MHISASWRATSLSAKSQFQEKIDVLDIIISVLKDHEETLSRLADKFDDIYEDISSLQGQLPTLDRALDRLDGLKVKHLIGTAGLKGPLAAVKCKDWPTFLNASQGALLVAFEVSDDQCIFYSVSDLFIFTFSEGVVDVRLLMDRGVKKWLRRSRRGAGSGTHSGGKLSFAKGEAVYEARVSPKTLKQWLSLQLGIPEEKVIEGRVLG